MWWALRWLDTSFHQLLTFVVVLKSFLQYLLHTPERNIFLVSSSKTILNFIKILWQLFLRKHIFSSGHSNFQTVNAPIYVNPWGRLRDFSHKATLTIVIPTHLHHFTVRIPFCQLTFIYMYATFSVILILSQLLSVWGSDLGNPPFTLITYHQV